MIDVYTSVYHLKHHHVAKETTFLVNYVRSVTESYICRF